MTGCQADINPLFISANFLTNETMDKSGACHNCKKAIGILQILIDFIRRLQEGEKMINLPQGNASTPSHT